MALDAIMQQAVEPLGVDSSCLELPVGHREHWATNHHTCNLKGFRDRCRTVEPRLRRTFNGGPWAKHFADIASSLRCFLSYIELEQENPANLSFLHAVSCPGKKRNCFF